MWIILFLLLLLDCKEKIGIFTKPNRSIQWLKMNQNNYGK